MFVCSMSKAGLAYSLLLLPLLLVLLPSLLLQWCCLMSLPVAWILPARRPHGRSYGAGEPAPAAMTRVTHIQHACLA
jgi:hypothetical protein